MSKNKKSVQPMHADSWGWWITIVDEISARHAIRMAGLPLFFLGLIFSTVSLVTLIQSGLDPYQRALLSWQNVALLPLGLILIGISLIVRKRGDSTVLLAVPISMVAMGLSIIVSDHPAQWIVPALVMIVSFGGLRGWWWRRQNS